ncbi:MAG: CBS domain-containing protein [Deltaproteobacteria bacterium]|jgi:CBS domain-containing protein
MSSLNTSLARSTGRPRTPFVPARVETRMRLDPLAIPMTLPLESTLDLLFEEEADWALVVNETEELVGVVARSQVEDALGREPDVTEELDGYFVESVFVAADVMQPYVRVLRPWMTASEALALMEAEGLEFAPVVIEGDTRAAGAVHRSDLEDIVAASSATWRSEPHGTYRDGFGIVDEGIADDRRDLVRRASRIADAWLGATAVAADAPGAVTFAAVMLPVLSELYDKLVEHYSDLQEHALEEIEEASPSLSARIDDLRRRQGDALAHLSGLMGAIRRERRPRQDRLQSIQAHLEVIDRIETDENELFYVAHYVDVGEV